MKGALNLSKLLLYGRDPHEEQDFDKGDDIGFWFIGGSCRRRSVQKE